jgi:CheY-like chemotaxis protein
MTAKCTEKVLSTNYRAIWPNVASNGASVLDLELTSRCRYPEEGFLAHAKGVRNTHDLSCNKYRAIPLVYVVDDEPIIASTLAAILKLAGYDAHFFVSPLKALEAAGSKSPDLLISDVVMAELNGIDLAILMTSRFPECKILLFSGQATTCDLLEKAHEKGYRFRLLSKPIHPDDMLAEVKQMTRETAAHLSLFLLQRSGLTA